ncbi:LOW QUALITY PROTEIN: FAD-dependent urate hydroxylase [Aspergillus udagawae]|uniref:FAD-dependent urate hydroxylase n=1 Tax=Aspergillus udagawae TaxID=91492 RepID=A0A8H3PFG8_9EURO|nr:LOW QUALITY PROTEIN: FAD-dependent urate hydroxylase [Aspergillus udagawae]
MPRCILIVGGGIAGLTASIALAKYLAQSEPDLRISVYESRLEQSIGRSLTPAAQHYLNQLGILHELDRQGEYSGIEVDEINIFSLLSGRSMGPLKFADENGCGRCVLRNALFRACLAVTRKYTQISVVFKKKLASASTTGEKVTLHFNDGTMVIGDLLLGCDGVHSTVRTQLIDPDNHSEYSGVSFIQSLANANRATLPTQFDQTAIHLTRHGSLLTSYYNASHQIMFVAAIMPVNDFIVEQYRKLASSVQDDEMLKLTQMALRYQVRSKFGVSAFSWIREWIDKSDLPGGEAGKMVSRSGFAAGGRCTCNAAARESAAYAIEDAVTILARGGDRSLSDLFLEY